ncbi:unnamed protein product [Rotaria sp. Silwood2]|nr:unnamed protein product [Rotaria sp. Silwood2]CAF3047177.1 unnamed protein product [Rotaria sp. Silwood2]CAF4272693.1 unnamed protein product [Rotaria sp. Silwood2]CAF4392823.1 unnamed protein product [Rotaria sp. Silwood2]
MLSEAIFVLEELEETINDYKKNRTLERRNTTVSLMDTDTTSAGVLVSRQQQVASAIPTGAADNSPDLMSPMMPNYMSQLVQNPRLLEGVLIVPYLQPLMDPGAANYDTLKQIIAKSPMLADSPAVREQMLKDLPTVIGQMRNSQVQSLMQNHQVCAAISQIQKGLQDLHIGLQRLHIAAPDLFQTGGVIPGLRFVPTGLGSPAAATGDSTNSPSTSSISTTSTGQTPLSTTGIASTLSSNDPSNYACVLAQILNMIPNQNINTPQDQHYAAQLDELASRGFTDRERNLEALIATMANMEAALERLIHYI